MKALSFEEKYAVIGQQDTQYEGIFITAVKTTGIFCRPSCRARKPKIENVEFYNTAQEALQQGYRPCKVCKPMNRLDETPSYISSLIKELHADVYTRIKDYDLEKRDINPNKVRTWFKKHHNMTFQTYQRMLRINAAYKQIKNGSSIADAAMESGYDSISGFNDGYLSIFGAPPSKTKASSIINIIRLTSPIGPMFACASQEGLCLLEFTDRRMLENEFKDLCKRMNAAILPGDNPHLDQVAIELDEYFKGNRNQFNVALHTPGSEFQNSVWNILQDIPYGETRSYKQQAIALNKPKAIRAVANANGMNRIAIIIPCHRVIGSNGDLTGYGGGLHRKQWLLDLEQKMST